MLDTYVALDLETTGFSPVNDSIIEVGAVKIINGEIADRYEAFVNPGRPISYKITEITGITDEMVRNAPTIDRIIGDIIRFVDGYVLLGHNIIFDYSFLKCAAARAGITYTTKGIDTHMLAKKALPQLESRSLESLCSYFGIATEHHRAYADALTASKVYEELWSIMGDSWDIKEATELIYRIPKSEPITLKQKSFLVSLVRKHRVELKKDLDDLTKSEASRLIDNILAEYGRN